MIFKFQIITMDIKKYLTPALFAAYQAGTAIIDIYNSYTDFNIQSKADNSSLTIADKKSNDVINDILHNKSNIFNSSLISKEIFSIPILSEEGNEIDYDERKHWEYFWLVDPLDGTKEFINRNGEFTVNIALIRDITPVLGVVYIPVTGVIFFATENAGAFKCKINFSSKPIPDTNTFIDDKLFLSALNNNNIEQIINKSIKLENTGNNKSSITVIASRSHMNNETEKFINDLRKKYKTINLISAGSSLKLCYVAEGEADIYPRLGPTMEWDTAAAHAVIKFSGRTVKIHNSDTELSYNKKDLHNPWFVVS